MDQNVRELVNAIESALIVAYKNFDFFKNNQELIDSLNKVKESLQKVKQQ